MFCGPSSRAIDCASARTACLPPAKAEKPRPPRRLAVAPVKIIVPWPRGTIALAASRAVRKPAKAVISQTLR